MGYRIAVSTLVVPVRNCFAYLAICGLTALVAASPAVGQTLVHPASALASARTIYFEDKSGVDAVGAKAVMELVKWGRFQIVPDRTKADLILLLIRDPDQGGYLIFAGGQTGSVDPNGHVQEDQVPTFNKAAPVSYVFLKITDVRTGDLVWSDSHRWGGLLTGYDSAGERLVKKLEQATQEADQAAQLRVVKSVNPRYPPGVSQQGIYGTVIVRISVDKQGNVSTAKAVSGPTELRHASEGAAKEWQFAPPQTAPVTTTLEMTYDYEPVPCPADVRGRRAVILWGQKFPISTGHPGQLKILEYIDDPTPPYPEKAQEEGMDGDVKLFITVAPTGEVIAGRVVDAPSDLLGDAALAAVRKWRFRVSHGSDAEFPITISFRMACGTEDLKQ